MNGAARCSNELPILKRLTGNWRRLLALGALAAVLIWLLIKTGAVSPVEHYRYLRDLRDLGQADIEVNAGVLAVHAELRLNYDGLIAQVQRSRVELDAVARIPALVDAETRAALLAQMVELKATILAKAAMVDRFQRANSVWRNSVDYFPARPKCSSSRPQPVACKAPMGGLFAACWC